MDMPMRCVSLIIAETVVEFGALPYIEDCVAASAAAPKPAGEIEARSASATATEKLTLKLRGGKGGGSAGGGSAGGSAGGGGEGGSGESGGGEGGGGEGGGGKGGGGEGEGEGADVPAEDCGRREELQRSPDVPVRRKGRRQAAGWSVEQRGKTVVCTRWP
jgi:hypothetical protein